MYKVLVIINVKMLEKSLFVTVNSTVYQNVTAQQAGSSPSTFAVRAGGNGFPSASVVTSFRRKE